jgi:hypothetical protein
MDYSDEYAVDQYNHLLDLEKRRLDARLPYLDAIRPRARWAKFFIDIAENEPGEMAVAFRAAEYMERFMIEEEVVNGYKIQNNYHEALGACLLIASKFEVGEDYVELSTITFNLTGVNAKDLLKMEKRVLNVLGFDMASATAISFLYLYAEWLQLDLPARTRASGMCEQSLAHHQLRAYRPSLVAICCINLSIEAAPTTATPFPMRNLYEPFHREQFEECIALVRVLCCDCDKGYWRVQ